jgi:hypothetical protein
LKRKGPTRRRRSGRARSTSGPRSLSGRSNRGGRQPAEEIVTEPEPMISALIRENRDRQIDELSRQTAGGSLALSERALRSLGRRVQATLDVEATGRRRRPGGATSTSTAKPKVTDPELLERRRQALAKARSWGGQSGGPLTTSKSPKPSVVAVGVGDSRSHP